MIFTILFDKDNGRPVPIEKEFYQLREFITSEDDLKCYLCEHNAQFVASYNSGIDVLISHFLAEDPNFDTQALETKKISKKDEALPNYLKFLPSLSKTVRK